MMREKKVRFRVIFWLDVVLLVCFSALESVNFTGLILHEWVGLAMIVLVVVHLLLSWAWISSTTRALIRPRSGRALVNYVLNLALFGCVTGVIFSGILVSQHAIPLFTKTRPLPLGLNFSWERLHDRLSNFVVIFAGLHLAINWNWIAAALRKIGQSRAAGEA